MLKSFFLGVFLVATVAVRSAHADVIEACIAKGFEKAALANRASLAKLSWNFYGRQEIGWDIVAPIIARDLATSCAPQTPVFAAQLAAWQKRHNKAATGIMTVEMLLRFSRQWQQQRTLRAGFGKPYAGCIYGPAGDLMDIDPVHDRTSRQIMPVNKVDPQAYAAYLRLLAAAARDLPEITPDGALLKIFSAHRTPEYNKKLCAMDNRCDGTRRATCSLHFTGRALDLVVGGKNGDTTAENRREQSKGQIYLWLLNNAEKFGFVNYAYEPWHWEYAGRPR